MAYTTRDFWSLTQKLDSIFVETAKNKIAMSKWMSLFNVQNDQYETYVHQLLHGGSWIWRVSEWWDYPKLFSQEWDQITYTQSIYGWLATITERMLQFERYNNMKDIVKSATDEAFDKIDQSMSDLLLNGWSTSYTDVYSQVVSAVWPDGLALFSASHTNGTTSTTYSNIINDWTNNNPSLSRPAIVKARVNARKYTDPNGLHRPIMLDTLVVWPDLEDLALRITNSENIQGSGNNDTNGNLKSVKVEVWDRLGSNSAWTDTSAYFFMMDSSKKDETLKAFFSEKPKLFAPEVVYNTWNWEYKIRFIYSLWRGFAPYVVWSKGTNS